jgi:hypothetical protein
LRQGLFGRTEKPFNRTVESAKPATPAASEDLWTVDPLLQYEKEAEEEENGAYSPEGIQYFRQWGVISESFLIEFCGFEGPFSLRRVYY